MRSGEVLRRHLRQNRVAVEQHDATLEIPLGLEFGIACRIESFDERNLFGGYKFLSKCNDLHGCEAAASIVLGNQVAFASEDGISLTIDEKDQASSLRDGQLIILLNFQNVRAQLDPHDDAVQKIKSTADRYARAYLAMPKYEQVTRAVVYPVYIQSMDEYRQAKFSGMIRLGTITFERGAAEISIVENKLSIP